MYIKLDKIWSLLPECFHSALKQLKSTVNLREMLQRLWLQIHSHLVFFMEMQDGPTLAPSCACLKRSLSLGSAHSGGVRGRAFSSYVPGPGHRPQRGLSTLKWEAGMRDSGHTILSLPFTVTATIVCEGDI